MAIMRIKQEICSLRFFLMGIMLVMTAVFVTRLFPAKFYKYEVVSNFDNCKTSYRGVSTGLWTENLQETDYDCGENALSFFLNAINIPTTPKQVRNLCKKEGVLSLYDLQNIVEKYGLKTQAIKVKPKSFKEKPTQAIIHLKQNHYVVLVKWNKKEVVLFDPAYGQVYVDWNVFLDEFSGNILYIYE